MLLKCCLKHYLLSIMHEKKYLQQKQCLYLPDYLPYKQNELQKPHLLFDMQKVTALKTPSLQRMDIILMYIVKNL